LRIADDDCVGVRRGILRHERYVRAAEHDLDATRTEMIREPVAARRGGRDHRHADDIRFEIERDVADAFVDERNGVLDLRWNEAYERGQCERGVAQRAFENARAMPV